MFAPPVTLASLAGTSVAGVRIADQEGRLTGDGLCAFWAVVSTVFCTLVYKLSRFYSPLLFKSYRGLSLRDKREWDVRYGSMPHAFLCIVYACVMLSGDFFYKEAPVPSVFRTCDTSYTALGISLGFFIVDFVISWKYHMGGNEMLAHHIGAISSVLVAVLLGQGHMHTIWMLVTEATTPFVNLRWWLDKANMKATLLYFYNGVSIFLTWIIFRLVTFPPFFYVVWQQRGQVELLWPGSVVLLMIVPFLLLFLNIMWFYKIVKGVIKLMTPAPAEKKAA